MKQQRVAVTGIGIICALGKNLVATWDALRQGAPAISSMPLLESMDLKFQRGAEVRDFVPSTYFEERRLSMLDRYSQFALIAASEALADSGLAITPEVAHTTAVVTGSCLGGQSTNDETFVALYQKHASRANPLSIARAMANAGACHISMQFGITGPTFNFSTACVSASNAIGQAFWMVRNGQVSAAIAGGSEAPFSYGVLKAWEAMRIVAPDTCRPFSADRQGLIVGEGAAMLVLEPLEAARAAGKKVYCEICGFGMSSDASHLTLPNVAGPCRAMEAALADAALQPEQVTYINAHGSGTLKNDPTETQAIRHVFGNHAEKIAVSSTKSMHGHALGASGALEAVATAMAIHNGTVPPTANFIRPDPECDLDVVPNQSRAMAVEAALSNSFAFGGLNSVLAFQRAA